MQTTGYAALLQDEWSNPLTAFCAGVAASCDLPTGRVRDPLQQILEDRPDIFIANHNPSSDAFYLQLGCSNCSSKTDMFQPQHEAALLETVPANVEG